jgi:Protein of unknown function (DUF1428)
LTSESPWPETKSDIGWPRKEHGALEYIECVADDVNPGKVTSFPQAVQLEAEEVVVFSWIVYRSRENGSAGNAVRRQANVLGWVRGPPCDVRTPHKTASVRGGSYGATVTRCSPALSPQFRVVPPAQTATLPFQNALRQSPSTGGASQTIAVATAHDVEPPHRPSHHLQRSVQQPVPCLRRSTSADDRLLLMTAPEPLRRNGARPPGPASLTDGAVE